MKRKWMKIPFLWLLAFLSSYSFGTSYSDGTTLSGWSVYDNTPSGATVTLENGAIKLVGIGGRNAYILGNKSSNRVGAWNNTIEKNISFKMNYSENFTLYVIAHTTNGIQYIIYNTDDTNSIPNSTIGLGSSLTDGAWHTVSRNVEEDLQIFQSNTQIQSIEGIIIRGSGLLDDIVLESTSTTVDSTLYAGPWSVYDNTPVDATIMTENGVTQFMGNLTRNAYILGNRTANRNGAWNNRSQRNLNLDLNYTEDFVFYVYVDTNNGLKTLLYTTNNQDVVPDLSTGLGTNLINGTWKHVSRNLDADLQKFEPNNTIISVNGIIVRGSGWIKNVTLSTNSTPPPTSINILPAYDYSSKIDYYDSTAMGDWYMGANNHSLSLLKEGNAYVIKTIDDVATGIKKGWKTKVNSKKFHLDPTKRYQAVIRMKAKSYPLGQNILVTVVGPTGDKGHRENDIGKSKWEGNWNVSSHKWEEISLVLDPSVIDNPQSDEWYFQFMASTKYRAYKPSEGSEILIDENIDVFEIPKGKLIVNTKNINLSTDKTAYVSSFRKIDKWGNFYVKENGVWKHIFPKLIYRDTYNNQLFERYKNYGFNGIMNISTAEQIQNALNYGLTNLSLNAEPHYYKTSEKKKYLENKDINYTKTELALFNLHTALDTLNTDKSVIFYNLDNEKNNIRNSQYHPWLANYIDSNRIDSTTGKRRYPIYYLNGHYGLTRTYKNSSRDFMDVTGSYSGEDVNASNKDGKKEIHYRLISQFITENQSAPVSVIQLQKHFTTKFVPSLFWGIIQGGRALSVWRDGEPDDKTKSQLKGVPNDFRENVWANSFRDEISPRLDTMLPIIKTPQFTSWTAVNDNYPVVRMGTRELNGKGYLILANFGEEDKTVTVTLDGFTITSAHDYFTNENISVNSNIVTFTLGHHNQGYKVIELVQ